MNNAAGTIREPQSRGGRAERVIDGAIVLYLVVALFSIAASQIVMVVAGLTWLGTLLLRRPRRRPRLPLIWSLSAFGLTSLFSALGGLDVSSGLWGLRSLWIPFLFFYACVDRLQDSRTAGRRARLLVGFAWLAAVHGLLQSAREGLDFRITGALSHYMTFAGVLMLAGLLGLALVLVAARGRRDLPWALAVLTIFAALLLTQTRSAWLGLAAGSVTAVGIWRPRFLALLPVVGLCAVLLAPLEIQQRMRSLLDPRNVTAVERLYMWDAGARIVRDHPWTGVGPGRENLKRIYPRYKRPDDPWLPDHPFTHLHNNLMQIAVERGLPALVSWSFIWLGWLWHVQRIRSRLRDDDPEGRALLVGSVAAVCGFLVAGLFEYNFGDSEVINLTCFIMALPFAVAHARGAAPGEATASDGVLGESSGA